jgi:hypothetical protein
LIAEAKASGEKVTPKQIDDKIMGLERQEAALRAIEAVEGAGGTAYYYSLDLRDGDKVTAVVDDIRQRHGKIDVLLHAGGLLIDKRAAQQGAAPVRAGLRHQGGWLLQPDQGGEGHADRRDGELQLGGRALWQQRPERLLVGQRPALQDQQQHEDVAARHTRHRHRLDGLGADRHGLARLGAGDPRIAGCGYAAAGSRRAHDPPRADLRRHPRRDWSWPAAWVPGSTEKDPTAVSMWTKLNAQLGERKNPLLMVGQVKSYRLYGGIEVETTLDPKVQPFLFDHAPDAGSTLAARRDGDRGAGAIGEHHGAGLSGGERSRTSR